MHISGWIWALLLAVTGVIIYVILLLAERERLLPCHQRSQVLWVIPSIYILYLSVLLFGLIALLLYYWCVNSDAQNNSNNCSLIAAYYLLTVIGIFLVTWIFFTEERPSWTMFIGIFLVILGLIIYTY